MIRSALAVIAGYLVMALIVMVYFTIISLVKFGGMPDPDTAAQQFSVSLTLLILFFDLLTGFAGGFVTAWIARFDEMKHAWRLALFSFIAGAIMSASTWGQEPLWYVVLRQAGMFVTILAGGHFRAKMKKS